VQSPGVLYGSWSHNEMMTGNTNKRGVVLGVKIVCGSKQAGVSGSLFPRGKERFLVG